MIRTTGSTTRQGSSMLTRKLLNISTCGLSRSPLLSLSTLFKTASRWPCVHTDHHLDLFLFVCHDPALAAAVRCQGSPRRFRVGLEWAAADVRGPLSSSTARMPRLCWPGLLGSNENCHRGWHNSFRYHHTYHSSCLRRRRAERIYLLQSSDLLDTNHHCLVRSGCMQEKSG